MIKLTPQIDLYCYDLNNGCKKDKYKCLELGGLAVPEFGEDEFINVYDLRAGDILLKFIDQTVVHGIRAKAAGVLIL